MDAEARSVREPSELNSRRRRTAALAALELLTGGAAIVGGVLLALRPDGSLLGAKRDALAGTPFSDWRAPGVLLATLVGGGGLVAGCSVLAHGRYARPISTLFGVGLFAFEVVEGAWIGFQPLQALFGAVGVGITAVANRGPLGARPPR
jgi:hypothetical protein